MVIIERWFVGDNMDMSRRILRDNLGNNIASPTTTDMCYEPSTGKTQEAINLELKARVEYLEHLISIAEKDPENIRVRPFTLAKLSSGWGVLSNFTITIPNIEIITDKYIRVYYGYQYDGVPVVTLGADRVVLMNYRVWVNNPQPTYCDIGFLDSMGREVLISNIEGVFNIQIMVAGR